MSLWSTIATKLKEILGMVGSRTIENTLHVSPIISSEMETAILLWSDMYKDQAPWVHEPSDIDPSRVVSLGIPALIASEKARTALLEFGSEVTTPIQETEVDNPDYMGPTVDEIGNLVPDTRPQTIKQTKPVGSTERADYLNEQYKKLKKKLRTQIEYGIAKGGLVIKPYVVQSGSGYEIEFAYTQADAFFPLAFDTDDKIIEAAFIQTHVEKDAIFHRLEYHKWLGNGGVQIINKAFKTTSNLQRTGSPSVDLGQEVPLTSVNEWKDIEPSVTINDVNKPLFAYFKMPEANTVDPASPLGVSGYSRAINLIKDADMQYSRLLWEYEGGEMAIDVDRDALKFLEDASMPHSVMPKMQQRLFRRIDLGSDEVYNPFAPQLRDTQYIQGLNAILMRIEDATGLSRGTLSDVTIEAKTATELKMLKQRSYQTNEHIQEAIQDTLEDVVYIMNVYCDLYNITPDGEYEISFEWDDSLITDKDDELGKRITLQQNGLTSRLENRMWYFGETERQAMEALSRIDEENMRTMQTNMMLESNQFNMEERNKENANVNDVKGIDTNL